MCPESICGKFAIKFSTSPTLFDWSMPSIYGFWVLGFLPLDVVRAVGLAFGAASVIFMVFIVFLFADRERLGRSYRADILLILVAIAQTCVGVISLFWVEFHGVHVLFSIISGTTFATAFLLRGRCLKRIGDVPEIARRLRGEKARG